MAPTQNDPSSSSQPSTSKSNNKGKTDEQPYKPIVPFPNRLANNKTTAQVEKIREMFKQVQINVPLLDAIQQVPSYEIFLKDMCTKKRKINVPKKVFLTTNINELLFRPIPVKYRSRLSNYLLYQRTDHHQQALDVVGNINLLSFFV